jgi:hypothetical protein
LVLPPFNKENACSGRNNPLAGILEKGAAKFVIGIVALGEKQELV